MTTMLFPGGKRKALTLSYDDGVTQDRRLIDILDKYGLKCTFNLNAGNLGKPGKVTEAGVEVDHIKIAPEEVAELYKNHEVAGHGLTHPSLAGIGTPEAMREIIEDRRLLEQYSGRLVRAFAYPFGTHNEAVRQMLALAGYESARTVVSTHDFRIPENFLAWEATCHHADPELMTLARTFCEDTSPRMRFRPQLFYLWGHSYEFDARGDWDVIEGFASYVSGFADDIWFATNIEIVDYIKAYRALIYSADGHKIYNPSAVTVWQNADGKTYELRGGEVTEI